MQQLLLVMSNYDYDDFPPSIPSTLLTRGGRYTSIWLYRGIALMPLWCILCMFVIPKPDTDEYAVKIFYYVATQLAQTCCIEV